MNQSRPVVIDANLAKEAEDLGLDLREILEHEIARRIAAKRGAAGWTEVNREFVESYNDFVERAGLPGEEHRRFG